MNHTINSRLRSYYVKARLLEAQDKTKVYGFDQFTALVLNGDTRYVYAILASAINSKDTVIIGLDTQDNSPLDHEIMRVITPQERARCFVWWPDIYYESQM